jgi:hypothetical protein
LLEPHDLGLYAAPSRVLEQLGLGPLPNVAENSSTSRGGVEDRANVLVERDLDPHVLDGDRPVRRSPTFLGRRPTATR